MKGDIFGPSELPVHMQPPRSVVCKSSLIDGKLDYKQYGAETIMHVSLALWVAAFSLKEREIPSDKWGNEEDKSQ